MGPPKKKSIGKNAGRHGKRTLYFRPCSFPVSSVLLDSYNDPEAQNVPCGGGGGEGGTQTTSRYEINDFKDKCREKQLDFYITSRREIKIS